MIFVLEEWWGLPLDDEHETDDSEPDEQSWYDKLKELIGRLLFG